jgi:hypothetical protein
MRSLLHISASLHDYAYSWKADLPLRLVKTYYIMLERIARSTSTSTSEGQKRGLTERQTKPYTAVWHLTLKVELSGKKELKRMVGEIAAIYGYKSAALRTYFSGSWGRVASSQLKRIVGGAEGEGRQKILARELKYLEDK